VSRADAAGTNAIAAARDRVTTGDRIFSQAQPAGWNPHDAWLTRVKQPRELAARSSWSGPSTRPRQGTALRD